MVSSLRFTLDEVAKITNGQLVSGSPSTVVRVLSSDTRRLIGGALFIALRGPRYDAHEFLIQAALGGAIAAVVEDISNAPAGLGLIRVKNTLTAYGALASAHRKRYIIPMIAVTGSYGKTTTRALISKALTPRFNTLSSEANYNNEVGVPLTLLNLDSSREAAVLEMGMRGRGQIGYLTNVAVPTIGVITNIGPQHIELLGSLDNIAEAKAELIKSLPAEGFAVLPADDQYIDFLRRSSPCRVVTFGHHSSADYQVSKVEITNNGNISFVITHPTSQETANVILPLDGKHNAVNAAAALATSRELGVPLEDAARALASTEIPGHRMETTVNQDRGITILDDCYNAGPNSMRVALETLRDRLGSERKVAILGEMTELGEWAEQEHREIGKLASGCVGVVIGIGEKTRWILQELRGHVLQEWYPDVERANAHIWDILRRGDVILVKGSREMLLDRIVDKIKQ